MRLKQGGVAHTAWVIEDDLSDRETALRQQHIEGLADLAACALSSRSANTAEWQAVLPRQTGDEKSKERYISRFLGNPLIDPLEQNPTSCRVSYSQGELCRARYLLICVPVS
jgi:hypothetical protein